MKTDAKEKEYVCQQMKKNPIPNCICPSSSRDILAADFGPFTHVEMQRYTQFIAHSLQEYSHKELGTTTKYSEHYKI
jgi:hypothetical protein